jgi:hypothetical protein
VSKLYYCRNPYPVVQGVAIPLDFERFIPPDLEMAVNYYPSYLQFGGTWQIQPYLCDIVRQFAHYEADNGRAELWGGFEQVKDEVLRQFFAHVGIDQAFKMLENGGNVFTNAFPWSEPAGS